MKLIIQIPCLKRCQDSVALTGSLLMMAAVNTACRCAVHHIVDFAFNRGLARAFAAGIERAPEEDADVIVNTDADNRYDARDISRLLAPILERKAEFVIGARPILASEHFSPVKKLLQRLGSWVVRFTSDTDVEDAPSGFRAISYLVASSGQD